MNPTWLCPGTIGGAPARERGQLHGALGLVCGLSYVRFGV